jgi:HPt (histidine-containing phosphotransfer) domain-containing protein
VGLLQAAFAQGDREQVGRLAHRMKSSALAMGALGLGTLARRLEARLKAGPLDPADGA